MDDSDGCMVSVVTIIVSLLLFAALGAGWIAGYNYFKSRHPRWLVRFYMVYAVFRMVVIVGYMAFYIFLISGSSTESKTFALIILSMYVVMMTLTLILKH